LEKFAQCDLRDIGERKCSKYGRSFGSGCDYKGNDTKNLQIEAFSAIGQIAT